MYPKQRLSFFIAEERSLSRGARIVIQGGGSSDSDKVSGPDPGRMMKLWSTLKAARSEARACRHFVGKTSGCRMTGFAVSTYLCCHSA